MVPASLSPVLKTEFYSIITDIISLVFQSTYPVSAVLFKFSNFGPALHVASPVFLLVHSICSFTSDNNIVQASMCFCR